MRVLENDEEEFDLTRDMCRVGKHVVGFYRLIYLGDPMPQFFTCKNVL